MPNLGHNFALSVKTGRGGRNMKTKANHRYPMHRCLRFPMCCSVSKQNAASKATWVKNRGQISYF